MRNVRLLTLFNFFLDFRPYAPIVILFFKDVSGSFALALSIFSIATISSAVFEIPTGLFSDMIGRKKTIILGSLAGILGLTVWVIGNSFWMLASGAALEGLSWAFFSGNNDALLYDTLKESKSENRFPEFLGKTGSMFQAGLAISALLGAYLALWSFRTVLAVSIIPQAICFFIALFMVEPRVHTGKIRANIYGNLKTAFSEFIRNVRLRNLSLASVISNGIEETIFQFNPAFVAIFWPAWGLGVARFLGHASSAMGYWFSGPVLKRVAPIKIVLYGSLLSRIKNIIAVGFPTVISPVLLSTGLHGLREVSKGTLLQKEFTDHQRATMASLNSFLSSIFFGIFAFSFGYFADNIGPRNTLLVGELLLFVPAFLFWRVLKMK